MVTDGESNCWQTDVWSSGSHYIVPQLSSACRYRAVVVLESLAWSARVDDGGVQRSGVELQQLLLLPASDVSSHRRTRQQLAPRPPTSCIQVATQLMRSLSSSVYNADCALQSVLTEQFTSCLDAASNDMRCVSEPVTRDPTLQRSEATDRHIR